MANQGQKAFSFSISLPTPTDNTECWKQTEKLQKSKDQPEGRAQSTEQANFCSFKLPRIFTHF